MSTECKFARVTASVGLLFVRLTRWARARLGGSPVASPRGLELGEGFLQVFDKLRIQRVAVTRTILALRPRVLIIIRGICVSGSQVVREGYALDTLGLGRSSSVVFRPLLHVVPAEFAAWPRLVHALFSLDCFRKIVN